MSLDFPDNKSYKGKLLAMDKNINCEYLLKKAMDKPQKYHPHKLYCS